MFAYERKATLVHFKLKYNPQFEDIPLKSKQTLSF